MKPRRYILSAKMRRWEAEWLQSQKRSASDSISQGLQSVKKALSIDSMSADAYALEGRLYLLKAEELKDNESRLNLINKGRTSLEYALKLNRWLKTGIPTAVRKSAKMTASRNYEILMRLMQAILDR